RASKNPPASSSPAAASPSDKAPAASVKSTRRGATGRESSGTLGCTTDHDMAATGLGPLLRPLPLLDRRYRGLSIPGDVTARWPAPHPRGRAGTIKPHLGVPGSEWGRDRARRRSRGALESIPPPRGDLRRRGFSLPGRVLRRLRLGLRARARDRPGPPSARGA